VWFPPTLLGLLAVTFVISRVIPADPVALVAGETATPAQVAALRSQLGFDRPLAVQFVDYVSRLVRGDLGTSLYTTRPIADDLASRLAATIELTLVAMALSVLVGIPLGVVSALWRNSVLDHALRVITVSGLAIASFWLGIMLQLLFAMRLGWTPLTGRLAGFPPRGVTGALRSDACSRGTGRPSRQRSRTSRCPRLAPSPRARHAGAVHAGGGAQLMQSGFVLALRAGDGAAALRHRLEVSSAQRAPSTVTQISLLFGILLAGAVVTRRCSTGRGSGHMR
jgi:peptide/nickel transport system permease protein